MYCRTEVEVRNWDHVIPRSWFPDTIPPDLERWTVPSCPQCNAAHGRNEEYLLVRLIMCFGNDDARSAGIPERVIRSMDPRHGRDAGDARARAARHRELGRDMVDAPDPAIRAGVIPNFGPDESGGGGRAIQISGESLATIAEKVVRGFTYRRIGELIQDTHRIEWFLLEEDAGRGALDLMRGAEEHSLGPGILVRYLHTGEDAVASAFVIEIWNRLKLYATVNPLGITARRPA